MFLSIIGSLQVFDHGLDHDRRRPGRRVQHDGHLHGRHGFESYEWGYGNAVAVILFVIWFIAALLYQRFVLRRDIDGALTGGVG